MANWHNSNNSEISGKSYFEESPINKIKIKQNNINVQNGKYNREIFRVPMDKYSSRYESNSTKLGEVE